MRTTVAFGLVILSILLGLPLHRTETSPNLVLECEPSAAETREVHKAAVARRAASGGLREIQQSQPVDAFLLAAIEAETDPDRRGEALGRAVKSVREADLRAILDSLARDVSRGAAELRPLLVRRWAGINAPAAAAWSSQLPESSARCAALEQAAIAWANSDLSSAAGWVLGLPDGDSKRTATLGVAYEAARSDPVAALDLASTLAPTRERDDLLVHAVSQWSIIESTTAAAWAMGVVDPSLRDRLISAVAVALAQQDGAVAAALVTSTIGSGAEQDRAAVSIVQRWAQHSPQAAASWVSQFPGIPSRDAAVQNLVAVWTSQDSATAGNWVRELQSGSLRDVATTAYAQALEARNRSPALAAPAGGS